MGWVSLLAGRPENRLFPCPQTPLTPVAINPVFFTCTCLVAAPGGGDFGPKYQAHVGELQRQLDEARSLLEEKEAMLAGLQEERQALSDELSVLKGMGGGGGGDGSAAGMSAGLAAAELACECNWAACCLLLLLGFCGGRGCCWQYGPAECAPDWGWWAATPDPSASYHHPPLSHLPCTVACSCAHARRRSPEAVWRRRGVDESHRAAHPRGARREVGHGVEARAHGGKLQGRD